MRGLEALQKVRRLAEEKALEDVTLAQRDLEKIRMEEASLAAHAEGAKTALRDLERGRFGVRQSIVYRRYINALRGRMARVGVKRRAAREVVDRKIQVYEKARHQREAVSELIAGRKQAARKERERRVERALEELGQKAWAGNR